MKRCEGPGCDVEFQPERSTARYHSATCRQRAARARKAAAASVEADRAAGTAEHSLVRAVRLELEAAAAIETVAGQLALQIARRIADPDGSGVSTLSKELRSLLAEAKGTTGLDPTEPEESPVEPEEDDEVTRLRRQREQARQAAGLA